MTIYGILLVDSDWSNDNLTQIEKAAYLSHSDELITGTQVLVYIREPVDAIIAEAELTGDIIETETEPPNNTPGSKELAKTYLVPLKITRLKGHIPIIPLTRLKLILGADFSVFDETWIPLGADQYQQITTLWEKPKAS
ncbi:MAG TPA: hypothetical protein VHD90_04575 [Phototrophicaceae bacterium]|nr:hypothetical protein [Phototrophicaceae bacterium]